MVTEMVVDGIQELEERILAFIQNELLGPEMRVDRDDDLLSGDLIDSVAVLRLSAFVQEEFQIKIEPADFVIENFQNVAVLAEYVQKAIADVGHSSPAHIDR